MPVNPHDCRAGLSSKNMPDDYEPQPNMTIEKRGPIHADLNRVTLHQFRMGFQQYAIAADIEDSSRYEAAALPQRSVPSTCVDGISLFGTTFHSFAALRRRRQCRLISLP
jgi:hypothetical protein